MFAKLLFLHELKMKNTYFHTNSQVSFICDDTAGQSDLQCLFIPIAQILKIFQFSFPLLRCSSPLRSFNFTFIFSVYFVQRRVVIALLLKDFFKKQETFPVYILPLP